MSLRSRIVLILMAVLAAVLLPERATGQPPAPAAAPAFTYTVKYLCSHLHPFPTVFHWTDINILNPSKTKTARITKKFVVAGTQKAASAVKPVRDQFQLKPNQAAAIDCDEIQTLLKIPLSTPMEGFVEIESNVELTVVGIYDKCVPKERVDVFVQSEVRAKLRLEGLGEQDLVLTGPAVVKKGEMHIDSAGLESRGRFLQRTEMESMELEGTMRMPTGQTIPIRLIESPRFQSEGHITGEVDPVTLAPVFPARSYFDIFFEITSTDPVFQERVGRAYNVKAARVTATITGIPPGPPLAETRKDAAAGGSTNQYCQEGGPTEILSARSGAKIGEISNHCHDPNPPKPDPPMHAKVPCDNASIDVEYIQAKKGVYP